MENQEWQETVRSLVEVTALLASAWRILDGTDGAASGVEHALNSPLASIDAIYASEHVNAYNADVASPVDLEQFWGEARCASRIRTRGRRARRRSATSSCAASSSRRRRQPSLIRRLTAVQAMLNSAAISW
jgi:hypothetical protein